MILFLLGFALPYAALLAWGIRGSIQPHAQQTDWTTFAGLLLLIPLAAAWTSIELANLLRPRRLFDRRLRRVHLGRFALGLVSGVLSGAAAAALLPLVDRFLHDGVVTGASAALSAAASTLLLARTRRGHCLFCGYDLRSNPGPGHPGAGLCPECGATALA